MKEIACIPQLGALVLIAALVTPTAVQAEGFYIGAGGYAADIDIDDFDDSDTVPAAFVGYQFVDTNFLMLSAELGYYDLGSYRSDAFELESDAFSLAGVAYLPIGPFFELYGKAGIAAVSTNVHGDNGKQDSDSEEAFGGIGASWDILDTIDIYIEYLRFDTEADSEMIGLGVRFDFF